MARPAQTFLDDRSAHLFRIALAAVVAVTLLVIAPAAKAGLFSTGPADVCNSNVVHPFASWNDQADYVLIPEGSFEAGAPGWSLNGASVVNGNESFFVNGRTDSHSLSLPPGSSATTPSMCFAPGDWNLRLFATSRSTSTSYLKVTVIVRSVIGELSIVDGGKISSSSNWQPSPKIHLLLTNLTGLLGTRAAFFRFTPVGPGGAWRIDDVYLDPFKST